MPELPEVETTARLLRPRLVGRRIREVDVRWVRSLGGQEPGELAEALEGTRVTAVGRRAKYVRIDLARGRREAGALLVHLRMTGRLVVERADATPDWSRIRLGLDRGALHFIDVRKFGRLRWWADPDGEEAPLAPLGPEPLEEGFTAAGLYAALGARRRVLKPLLLDQTFLAGLGNIYVDESLHLARLHPLERSDRVDRRAAGRLHRAIRGTLEAAIEREGSSFDGFYRTPEGQPGSYQHLFRVYGRADQPCLRCRAPVERIVVAQRGTHLCPRCQPAPTRRILRAP
jgi:formamidopyrimidine-DNA glycosylase